MKTIVITLADNVPDSVLSANATVTIAGTVYNGKVTAILTHEGSTVPPTATVKLTGPGLTITSEFASTSGHA